jgi:putative membrane protein
MLNRQRFGHNDGVSGTPRLASQHVASVRLLRDNADYAFLVLIGIYSVARVLQVYRLGLSLATVIALHVIPIGLFAIVHGTRLYGWRRMTGFVGIALVVGNISENIGVRTGSPFGRYEFTPLMGPKLFAVPILLGIAYIGMAYLSWVLARIVVGAIHRTSAVCDVVLVPALAAVIMVSWDVSQEPVWSTVLRLWIWRDGGLYFGVPLSNFFGWYITVFVIFQLFALTLRYSSLRERRLPPHYWHQAVLFYAMSAAGNLVLLLPSERPKSVTDALGVRWATRDIIAACALVTILTMGLFALLAWRRLKQLTILPESDVGS